ncbi:hypothetical protein NC981_21545 [Leptolyngbya sp. DQ-M1]
MNPEQRSNFIGWVLIALALLWMAPRVPLIGYATVKASEQFWHEFQEARQ